MTNAKNIRIDAFEKAILGEHWEAVEAEFSILTDYEDDRGFILLSAALMDAAMADLISLILRPRKNKKSTSARIQKDGEGILGSYRARADLLYALGVLNKEEHSILVVLSEIRNICAHKPIHFSLADYPEKVNRLFEFQGHWFDGLGMEEAVSTCIFLLYSTLKDRAVFMRSTKFKLNTNDIHTGMKKAFRDRISNFRETQAK